MRELAATGWLSNRMRQVVAATSSTTSAATGARAQRGSKRNWWITDSSNQGNWLYIVGRGTDPRRAALRSGSAGGDVRSRWRLSRWCAAWKWRRCFRVGARATARRQACDRMEEFAAGAAPTVGPGVGAPMARQTSPNPRQGQMSARHGKAKRRRSHGKVKRRPPRQGQMSVRPWQGQTRRAHPVGAAPAAELQRAIARAVPAGSSCFVRLP